MDNNHLSRPVVAGPSNSMKRKTIVTRIWPRKFCSGWALHQDHYIATSLHITLHPCCVTLHSITSHYYLYYLIYTVFCSQYIQYIHIHHIHIHQTSYTVSRTNGFHFTILRVNKQVLRWCVIPQHCRRNFGQISGGRPLNNDVTPFLLGSDWNMMLAAVRIEGFAWFFSSSMFNSFIFALIF